MKIDLLKDKNNYIYVDEIDDDSVPFWYPTLTEMQYGTKEFIKYDIEASETDISIYIGWEESTTIDNIELEINSGTYSKIELRYSMDYFVDGLSEASEFDSFTWYPNTPVYLNDTITYLKEIEAKTIKITFTSCTDLNLENINIYKEETIVIDKEILNSFTFESFSNNIIKNYKDTDIDTLSQRNIEMLIDE